MARNTQTSAVIDGILTMLVSGGALAATITAPNVLIALDGPLKKYFKTMDARARKREMQRILQYMHSSRLIADDYAHGIAITEHGRRRLKQHRIQRLSIPVQQKWDHTWRLVLFDIPQHSNKSRRLMTGHLRTLGFCQLQQSAWIHPYPCKDIVKTLCNELNIGRFVSYLEVVGIQNEPQLIKRFSSLL